MLTTERTLNQLSERVARLEEMVARLMGDHIVDTNDMVVIPRRDSVRRQEASVRAAHYRELRIKREESRKCSET